MTDEDFKQFIHALLAGHNGPKWYAISEDELAIYLAQKRTDSPGVIVLNRNGTWRYDPEAGL